MSLTEFWSISVEARPGVLYTPRNFAEDSSGIMSLRRVASRVIRWQIGIGLSAAALWAVMSGVEAGLAALVGTGISVFMTFLRCDALGLEKRRSARTQSHTGRVLRRSDHEAFAWDGINFYRRLCVSRKCRRIGDHAVADFGRLWSGPFGRH